MTFEDKLKKLEDISESMRGEKLSLENSIESFEIGIKLANELEKELENYEKKVQILVNGDQLEDFK
ncbi:MAG: exodeoxyribonuclease VII small subunit [Spirochaetaceae bacterium 4572_7]|nr:MAG: exodeoxyribonuclease VII small subunit [Spirochaetaceae bacterium 4572_7]